MKIIKLFLISLSCCFILNGAENESLLPDRLFLNEIFVDKHLENLSHQNHFKFVLSSLSETPQDKQELYHILKEVKVDSGIFYDDVTLTLKDHSVWMVNNWHNKEASKWRPNESLKVSYHGSLSDICIENVDRNATIWCSLQTPPKHGTKIVEISTSKGKSKSYKVMLNNGSVFETKNHDLSEWLVNDAIFVFHKPDQYELWNIDTEQLCDFTLIQQGKSDILRLEESLNKRVLAQPEATKAISSSLINYSAGLNNPEAPIGTFLFMGPSGTGKTELAKALALEFYKSLDSLIRLDMSHYHADHTIERLIGSPPGYVNHQEGGQLTNALMDKPQSIILLDEIEKADPAVRKVFLPVFDEGYIRDSKDQYICCKENIFIMTSNICAQEIVSLFELGYEPDEILKEIEPYLMEELSPELYNRLTPVIFRPLRKDVMGSLVNLMLKDVIQRAKSTHNITLIVDDSAKEYLAEHGFHPQLGARPLKKLIENKITATLAYAIVSGAVKKNSTVTISYDRITDSWYANY